MKKYLLSICLIGWMEVKNLSGNGLYSEVLLAIQSFLGDKTNGTEHIGLKSIF